MAFVSYARNFEDVLLWRVFGNLRMGSYIDVSPEDPQYPSVTYAFYERGWSGINIQASPAVYDDLKKHRSREINLWMSMGRGANELENNVGSVRTLDQVLGLYGNGPIHFLRIGKETNPDDVLDGINLQNWRPWIIILEGVGHSVNGLAYHRYESKLYQEGYEFVYDDGLSRFYLAHEQNTLKSSFSTPPDTADDFILAREYQAAIEFENLQSQYRNLQQQNALLQKQLASNREELNAANSRLGGLTEELGMLYLKVKEQNYLYFEVDDVRERVKVLDGRLKETIHQRQEIAAHHEDASKELARIRDENERLKGELALVYRSRSYRITTPIRKVSGYARAQHERARFMVWKSKHSTKEFLRPLLIRYVPGFKKLPVIGRVMHAVKHRYPKVWRVLTWPVKKITLPIIDPIVVSASYDDEVHFRNLFLREIAKRRLSLFSGTER